MKTNKELLSKENPIDLPTESFIDPLKDTIRGRNLNLAMPDELIPFGDSVIVTNDGISHVHKVVQELNDIDINLSMTLEV